MLAPGRRAAATDRRAVDQVVVDERRHVHELDRDAGGDRWLASSRRRGEERERRPQSLAARRERARADLGDEARVALDDRVRAGLDLGEVLVEPRRRAHDLERAS